MTVAVLEVAWRVREGRECRFCGEDRAAMMARHRRMLDGLSTVCKACERVRGASYRADNRDKVRASGRAYTATHRDERRAYGRAYDRSRRARLAARTDAEIAAARDAAHPVGVKRCRAGHAAPVDAFRADRARLDGLNVYCSPCHAARCAEQRNGARLDWWAAHGIPLRCIYCHGPNQHADHVIPLAGGGADELWALRPACATCNLSKNDRPPLEWLASRPFLPYSDELAAVSWALTLYGELRPDFPVRIEIPEE